MYVLIRTLIGKFNETQANALQILSFTIILFFINKYALQKYLLKSQSLYNNIIGIVISIGMIEAIWGLLQIYGILPGYYLTVTKTVGSLGNTNSYGQYITMIYSFTIPITITSKKYIPKFIKRISLTSLIICLLVLPSTYCRNAWVACIIITIMVVSKKYTKIATYLNKKKKTKSLLYLTVVIFVIIYLYIIKPNSVLGRILIWKITSRIILSHFIFGIGYNRFAYEYGIYQAKYFSNGNGTPIEKIIAGVVHQAHNEYLQIFAELGLIGITIFILVLYSVIKNIITNKYNNRGASFTKLCSGYSLLSVIIMAVFSFPLHILPILVMSFLFLSILNHHEKVIKSYIKINQMANKLISIVLILLVINLKKIYANYSANIAWKKAYNTILMGIIN